MAQNVPEYVEIEAAKFLDKIGQEFKDEPKKLAAKLFTVRKSLASPCQISSGFQWL